MVWLITYATAISEIMFSAADFSSIVANNNPNVFVNLMVDEFLVVYSNCDSKKINNYSVSAFFFTDSQFILKTTWCDYFIRKFWIRCELFIETVIGGCEYFIDFNFCRHFQVWARVWAKVWVWAFHYYPLVLEASYLETVGMVNYQCSSVFLK